MSEIGPGILAAFWSGADYAAGIAQGAVDRAKGIEHASRAWVSEPQADERQAEAQARWGVGLPARNAFERDAYHALEIGISGHDRPKEAAAARQHPPYPEANREAGE
jgi:hypothetical protein